jgi:DNA-binding transcriptional MerR regulator
VEAHVRISELSRASGVPVPTIKWYLREGLLRPGAPTARNQADYDLTHLHRLRLVRVLVDVGGLATPAVRAVLAAIDDTDLPVHGLLGIAHHALGPAPDGGRVPDDIARARAEVDRFLAGLGWRVSPEAPARRALADALAALWRLGRDTGAEVFAPHAEAADRLAAQELGRIPAAAPRAEAVERAVVGTVVFEAALVALRRLAHEHHSAGRAAPGPGPPPGPQLR